jgi:hypothetical protein
MEPEELKKKYDHFVLMVADMMVAQQKYYQLAIKGTQIKSLREKCKQKEQKVVAHLNLWKALDETIQNELFK